MVSENCETITVRQAAERIGVSYITLLREIRAGRFHAVIRIGQRKMRVPIAALEKYLETAGACGAGIVGG